MGKRKILHTELQTHKEPTENQFITRVIETRGGGLYLTKEMLVMLPSKFHKLFWVKRGSWIIVEPFKESSTKVGGEIVAVLFREDIKHLKNNKLWNFSEDEKQESDSCNDDLFENTNRIVDSDSD